MTVESPPAVETPWRRLDPWMLVVGPVGGLVRLLPVAVILLVSGQGDVTRLWIAAGAGGLVVLAGIVRWRTTRYRITPDRVELHTGWLRRQRRSVPRDRIRTVDHTAKLLHRVFGLVIVQVSAASGAGADASGLSLDAIGKAEADRLRRELLDRPTASVTAPVTTPTEEVLARLDWSWLRFAPLTFSSLAGIGALAAAAFNLFGELGVDPRDLSAVDDATDRLTAAPVWLAVVVVGVLLLITAAVGSILLFAERWYDYRLTREPGVSASLRVKRGLLTRRSLSVSEQRLRGVEIVEPLLLRAGRGAQARALTTGLSKDDQGGALQPPAPRAEADRVASVALREHPSEIVGAPLRSHPPAARSRRLTRALVPTSVIVGCAFLVGRGLDAAWPGLVSLVLLPVALLLGLDRYRNLGHQLTGRYLVVREGSVVRRTVALHRTGVIGWTYRQSPFQRRAGLVTVEVVTAAGRGGYRVLDVATPDAVALTDAALPGLLTPFTLSRLPRVDHGAGGTGGSPGTTAAP